MGALAARVGPLQPSERVLPPAQPSAPLTPPPPRTYPQNRMRQRTYRVSSHVRFGHTFVPMVARRGTE